MLTTTEKRTQAGQTSGLSVIAGSPASLDPHEMFMECLRAGYRLLMRGDVMRKGDDALRLHDRQWLPLPSGWDVGHPWDPKHWPPVRRKQENQ